MKNEKQINMKQKITVKLVLFYLTYILLIPIFKYKKHRIFINEKIETLKMLQERMTGVALNSQKEMKFLLRKHKTNICQNAKTCMTNISKMKINLKNFSYVNNEVEGLDKILLHEEKNTELIKEFKNKLSSGIEEVNSLRQSYYSIAGYVYSRYHKWPRSIILGKSKFFDYEYISNKER